MAETEKKKRPAIQIKGLTKIFTLGKEKVYALNGIDLEIYPSEIICLLGTSGSGKSTLLNMMAGLEKPTKGSITIFGERVDNMSERRLAMFRQKYMGFVFQSYNLLPNLTAVDNVSLPLAFAGVRRSIRTKKAKQMLKLCGLSKRMHHKPTQMSGGQQQRVGIARAFVGTPKIVFADEPTGNLDTKTTIEIMEMMVRMSRENKQTLVIVTHDIEIAGYQSRRRSGRGRRAARSRFGGKRARRGRNRIRRDRNSFAGRRRNGGARKRIAARGGRRRQRDFGHTQEFTDNE